MKRRSFLAALFAAPSIPVVAKVLPPADPSAEARLAGDLPFVFKGGHLEMAAADVGMITAGTMRFGNTVIDAHGIQIGC